MLGSDETFKLPGELSFSIPMKLGFLRVGLDRKVFLSFLGDCNGQLRLSAALQQPIRGLVKYGPWVQARIPNSGGLGAGTWDFSQVPKHCCCWPEGHTLRATQGYRASKSFELISLGKMGGEVAPMVECTVFKTGPLSPQL